MKISGTIFIASLTVLLVAGGSASAEDKDIIRLQSDVVNLQGTIKLLQESLDAKNAVVASQIGNLHHPQWPLFEDFGDVMLRGDGGMGYIRVDWFTPDGLSTWGDGRLTIIGTDGFIEIRKNCDVGRSTSGNHLFLTDQKETRYFDCNQDELPYGRQLADDVLNRTETAMPQRHCFLAMELALRAQQQAQRIDLKK